MNKFSEFEEEKDVKQFDLQKLLIKYLSYWKWFILSFLIFISIAIYYLSFTLPSYEVTSSILIKDDQKGGGTAEINAFKEMGLFTQKNNVDNELEILSKEKIMKQAVRDLGIYATYTQISTVALIQNMHLDNLFTNFGTYKSRVLYGDECPFLITLPDAALDNLTEGIEFRVLVHPYGLYEFSGIFNQNKYIVKASISDKSVMLPFGKLIITRGKFRPAVDMTIDVVLQSPSVVANQILDQLKMELTSKTTSVVNISFITSNVKLGKDFVAKMLDVFNSVDLEDQTKLANKTALVIDDRLKLLTGELGDVESQAENYKQSQGITDIKSQSDLFVQQTGDFSQKKLDLETQLGIVSDLYNYIHRKENRYQLIPTSSGIKSDGLNELISNYNKLVLQKSRFSRIASSSNQAMIDLTNQIEIMFNTVESSVQNEKANLQLAERDLASKNNDNTAKIRAIPRQEKEYTEIKRQQGVKEALFLFLLQKKEEKFLNLSLVEPMSKFIDDIRSTGNPIAPKRTMTIFLAFMFALIVPIAGIKIRDLLRYQVESKEELEGLSNVPVLGEIPKSDELGNIIIKPHNTDSFTELVRLLRTNLLFVLDSPDKKVINVVSSMGGEGKTFVTINLALSLALLDKKVLVIGLDIRKPKLAEYLGMDNKIGMTSFLTGQITKEQLILSTNIHPNLSVIMAGPIPPNPNELLAKHELDKLITELRKEYDYIVIDTAPIGAVSDSFSLNRIADVNLYVVRANYTPKKAIEDATHLYKHKKLKSLYFVLNNIDKRKIGYSYAPGKHYGYGYGYEADKK